MMFENRVNSYGGFYFVPVPEIPPNISLCFALEFLPFLNEIYVLIVCAYIYLGGGVALLFCYLNKRESDICFCVVVLLV